MLNRNIFFGLLLLMVVLSAAARAYVAQDYGAAMAFGNYQRDVDDAKKADLSANSAAKQDVDEAVDNKAIAAKIFAAINKKKQDVLNKPYIYDFSDFAAKNIVLPLGATAFFVIPEEDVATWHIDCSNENVFKAVSSQKDGTDRILEFEAANLGFARIYMDNMDKSIRPAKTVKSIIVKVKVN